MNKEELIEEIEDKYNYCLKNEGGLEDEDGEDNELAIENYDHVFLQMGGLNDFTFDELNDLLEDITVTFNHLEDLGY